MSDLFIHVYLDEDVDVLIAELLRRQGFAATTTQEAGHSEWSDDEQLAYAAANGMAILTHNRNDFQRRADAYFAQGRGHAGIIIAIRRPAYEVASRVIAVLNQLTADEMQNQVAYV
ncbi:MAG TPA: DUF5615 family PIN-like protein [Herpetosiphonaceae bacterium]